MNRILLSGWVVLWMGTLAYAAELHVGAGKAFDRPEKALAAAKPGDTITLHPLAGDKPYEGVALFVATPRLTIRSAGKDRIKLSGAGFDYSGEGHIPRAIIQFNPGADGCALEGVELFGAHNKSHNGAGVRINQASDVTVRNCDIHDNDMGIMSNGNGTPDAGKNQLIESSLIHANGSNEDPGYNHNLYLGGTSVRLIACEIFASTTGHNVKSRAHQTFILNCFIHDAANREIDLVDAKGDTNVPNSDAVLIGNIIAKDPKCAGNRAVIHFGQDGGKGRDGTIWLAHNTILTPFVAPVLTLSTPEANARLINNLVCNPGNPQNNQVLVDFTKPGAGAVTGSGNWLSAGFSPAVPASLRARHGEKGANPPFADLAKRDVRLTGDFPGVTDAGADLPQQLRDLVGEGLFEYHSPLSRTPRQNKGKPDIGAFERSP